mmetsp:Transcript_32436/g.75659  ORF Transcript_32436/g.75659 Transcript_32436/m.75659 type:complete len:663 (-) Transcript_32436:212-2200(-)
MRSSSRGGGACHADQPESVYRLSERAPVLVRDVLERKGYREWEEEEDAEELWRIHWKAGRFKPSEYTTANRLQRLNHFPKTSGITKKDSLLRNLRRMRGIHGQIYAFFPESYILPTEYTTLVRSGEALKREKPIWILKPTDSSQGRKIFLIRDVSEISYGHFSETMTSSLLNSAERDSDDEERNPKLDDKGRAIQMELDMSTTLKMLKSRLNNTVTPCVKFTEMHIVQRYIERPLCVCGYKLDLRLYVLLASANPLRVYMYRDCLVRFATHKYDLGDLENTYSHLTNSSINKFSASYSTDKEGIRAGCKWSFVQWARENPDHPLTSPLLWARIKAIVNLTLLSIAAGIPDNGGCFELFGYDVIVDEQLKPWLLEVNTSPALAVECEADRQVKEPLISDLVDLLEMQHASASNRNSAQPRAADSSRRLEQLTSAAKMRGSVSSSAQSRKREAAAAEVQQLPTTVGGYELIFPFNQVTAAAASCLGGNESHVVAEIKAELQAAAVSHGTASEAGRQRAGGAAAVLPVMARAGAPEGTAVLLRPHRSAGRESKGAAREERDSNRLGGGLCGSSGAGSAGRLRSGSLLLANGVASGRTLSMATGSPTHSNRSCVPHERPSGDSVSANLEKKMTGLQGAILRVNAPSVLVNGRPSFHTRTACTSASP